MDHGSCIYMIENTVNGKKYIGQTKDFHARMNSHISALKNRRSHNRHLQAAFLLYGENAFKFSIVEYCDISQLDAREQYWIGFFDSYRNGYNLDMGGSGIRGYHYTEEQKQNISNALKGRVFSDETRKKMSRNHADVSGSNNPGYGINYFSRLPLEKQEEIRQKCSQRFSGANNPNYGKKMSDEQKKKLSESHKRRFAEHGNPLKGRKRPEFSGGKAYNAHAVVCVNTGVRFPTIKEAAETYGITQSAISSCCSGDCKYAGKDAEGNRLLWMSLDTYTPMTQQEIADYFSNIDKVRTEKLRRAVRCITTGEVFSSMKAACEKYQVDPSSLSSHCRGKRCLNGCGKDSQTGELLKWEYIT